MPWDGVLPETKPLSIAWERAHPPKTEEEMLRRLVPWLRLPELPGWKWDYLTVGDAFDNRCGTFGCALGWARSLWQDAVMGDLQGDLSDKPFYRTADRFDCDQHEVTPAMVADYICELLGG